jgi:hypothetical protein
VSGLGMIPIVFVYWFWMASGLYYKTTREEREKKLARGELCPTYTNLAVYETPFPGLVAFFSILQGMSELSEFFSGSCCRIILV